IDFVQINGKLNVLMIERALQWLEPKAGEHVLDLFCGLGNFTLPLAKSGAHVTAAGGDAGLVARARGDAARNDLANRELRAANLMDPACLESSWAQQPYEKILLDPPRAGAREVLPLIERCGAHTVLYISCHPGSFARDAGILVNEYGFVLEVAGVMDMFP